MSGFGCERALGLCVSMYIFFSVCVFVCGDCLCRYVYSFVWVSVGVWKKVCSWGCGRVIVHVDVLFFFVYGFTSLSFGERNGCVN